MEIGQRKTDGIVILDLSGRLDIPGAALFKRTVRELLDSGSRLFAINLTGVDYIGKETVGALVSIKKQVADMQGKIVIFSAKWDVKEYIEKFSFETDIPLVENEGDALAALGLGPRERRLGDPVYLALGSSAPFKELFWKAKVLGGVPLERFELIEPARRGMAARKVEVILLDALMPRNSALQAVKELRMDKWTKDAVIFVIGPDSSRTLFNAMRDYGADDFVPIPFAREELVSSIDGKQFFELLKKKFALWAEGYYEKRKG